MAQSCSLNRFESYVRPPVFITTALAILAFCLAAVAAAQDAEAPQRAIDRRPFDQIKLKASAGGNLLEVTPLRLPQRRVPDPLPGGRLTVQLTSKPGIDYILNWSDVESIRLYEQMILAEAGELTREKQFDQAFDYFAFLEQNYPQLPGLATGIASYLQADALEAFRQENYDLALAILISLYDRNPSAAGLDRAVEVVAGKIIDAYKDQGRWRAARSVLNVVEQKFSDAGKAVAADWRRQFQEDADRLVQEGANAYRTKNYRAARIAAIGAVAIVPDHRNAQRLMELVDKNFPSLTVGVRTLAPQPLVPRIDSTASLRTSRLARRTITELSGYSPEGGVYTCPLGRVSLEDSGDRLRFSFSPAIAKQAPSGLARQLLELANPDAVAYDRAFASLAETVDAQVGQRAELLVGLTRPHIRPDALLRHTAIEGAAYDALNATFAVSETTPDHTILATASSRAAIAEVQEQLYTEDGAALRALVTGEIALLDRVMPWQLDSVRSDRRVVLGAYDLPTVHVLIPNAASALLDKRPLRRALLYALDRQRMLQDLILGGRNEIGFQVVSGPFPVGRNLADPIHYAYNDGVEPRAYDPRLGALLASLAWAQTQRAEHGKEDPADRPFPTLKLAHNSDPIARSACQSIQMQLNAVGVPIELQELTESEVLDPAADFDLRYAELAMWEPLVDAQRLLGPDGIAGRCSDPMIAALGRLDQARNWPEVSSALRDVHALAAGELPVLPLWQTVNFYAYRRGLQGMTEKVVALYQTMEGWSN